MLLHGSPLLSEKHICVSFEPIDGKDNVVGFARPLLIRASGDDAPLTVTGKNMSCAQRIRDQNLIFRLYALGEMVFDTADLGFDGFGDVLVSNANCIVLDSSTSFSL